MRDWWGGPFDDNKSSLIAWHRGDESIGIIQYIAGGQE